MYSHVINKKIWMCFVFLIFCHLFVFFSGNGSVSAANYVPAYANLDLKSVEIDYANKIVGKTYLSFLYKITGTLEILLSVETDDPSRPELLIRFCFDSEAEEYDNNGLFYSIPIVDETGISQFGIDIDDEVSDFNIKSISSIGIRGIDSYIGFIRFFDPDPNEGDYSININKNLHIFEQGWISNNSSDSFKVTELKGSSFLFIHIIGQKVNLPPSSSEDTSTGDSDGGIYYVYNPSYPGLLYPVRVSSEDTSEIGYYGVGSTGPYSSGFYGMYSGGTYGRYGGGIYGLYGGYGLYSGMYGSYGLYGSYGGYGLYGGMYGSYGLYGSYGGYGLYGGMYGSYGLYGGGLYGLYGGGLYGLYGGHYGSGLYGGMGLYSGYGLYGSMYGGLGLYGGLLGMYGGYGLYGGGLYGLYGGGFYGLYGGMGLYGLFGLYGGLYGGLGLYGGGLYGLYGGLLGLYGGLYGSYGGLYGGLYGLGDMILIMALLQNPDLLLSLYASPIPELQLPNASLTPALITPVATPLVLQSPIEPTLANGIVLTVPPVTNVIASIPEVAVPALVTPPVTAPIAVTPTVVTPPITPIIPVAATPVTLPIVPTTPIVPTIPVTPIIPVVPTPFVPLPTVAAPVTPVPKFAPGAGVPGAGVPGGGGMLGLGVPGGGLPGGGIPGGGLGAGIAGMPGGALTGIGVPGGMPVI